MLSGIFKKASRETAALIAISAACFGLALSGRYAVVPMLHRVTLMHMQADTLSVLMMQHTGEQVRRTLHERREAVREKYITVTHALADSQSLARTLQAIFDEAWRHEVSIGATQPQQELQDAGFIKVPVAFTMTGSFVSMYRFIDKLENAFSAIRIERLSLNRLESGAIEAKMVVLCLFSASGQHAGSPKLSEDK